MALNCTLVDIDSMFYTSVQGTYFYQVIFGIKFKFSENQSTLRFHYPYRAPSILLRSRHYGCDFTINNFKINTLNDITSIMMMVIIFIIFFFFLLVLTVRLLSKKEKKIWFNFFSKPLLRRSWVPQTFCLIYIFS